MSFTSREKRQLADKVRAQLDPSQVIMDVDVNDIVANLVAGYGCYLDVWKNDITEEIKAYYEHADTNPLKEEKK